MRTLSVSPIDANEPDRIQDLDNRVIDGLHSLQQRMSSSVYGSR